MRSYTRAQYGEMRTKRNAIMRDRYREEYDVLRARHLARGVTHQSACSAAAAEVCNNHPEEAAIVVKELRDTTKPAGREKIPGPRRELRREIDPMDAEILLARGMQVADIARYDGCTQQAVINALAPTLMKKPSPYAGWWEKRRMAHDEAAKTLGCEASQVFRALAVKS